MTKFNFSSIFLIGLLFSLMNCSSDDPADPMLLETVTKKIVDLHAPQTVERDRQTGAPGDPKGEFVKINLSTGQKTDSATEWDIAFRATTILVNGGSVIGLNDEPPRTGQGGAYIESGVTFSALSRVIETKFKQDKLDEFAIPRGSDNGWYNYNPTTHLITPIPGRTLVVRTHDGKYAKVEILSYYKGAPDPKDIKVDPITRQYTHQADTYTFNYAYQPNEGETTF